MTWQVSTIVEGYSSDGIGEIEVHGTVISPGKDDPSIHSLDIKEAASYINYLEEIMSRVLEAHIQVCGNVFPNDEDDEKFESAIQDMAEALSSDAWTLLRAHQDKETNSNGATSKV